jgi:TruD family tRNA pseudouridine synthase
MNIEKTNFLKNIGIAPVYFDGSIKADLYDKPDDFIVEEIHPGFICDVAGEASVPPTAISQKYILATLVKKNISTFNACEEIARENKIPLNHISYCGLKDTVGLTSQRICILNEVPLVKAKFNKFFLKDFQESEDKLDLRSHKGNRFRIRAKNIVSGSGQECQTILKEFAAKVKKGLPNFYGPQRFGIRQNNHILGKLILEQNYDEFIKSFLTDMSKNESLTIRETREKLKDNFGDWEKCREILKGADGLEDESELVANLISQPKEEAICHTHRSSFFIHSFSSYLFNQALSLCLSGENVFKKEAFLDKIGANTEFDEFNAKFYSPVFEKENMKLADFRHPRKELNISGHPRRIFFYPENFEFETKNNEIILTFDLGIGEYASLLLGELFEGGFENKLN